MKERAQRLPETRHSSHGKGIEIEVFEDGAIESVQVKPGEKVPVGAVLAMIRGAGPEQPPISAAAAPAGAPVLEASRRPAAAPLPQTDPWKESRRLRASPMARKLAADLGIDVTRVEGTGSQGAITREDVERAAAALKKPVAAIADRDAVGRSPRDRRAPRRRVSGGG